MNRNAYVPAVVTALFPFFAAAAVALASPDDVLVENSYTKLTRGDYEADLLRLPPDMRNALAADPRRLTGLLNNILIAKTLAVQARQAGIDRDPGVANLINLEIDRVLSQLELQRLEKMAGAEFDAKSSEYLQKARERYLVDKDKFRIPEQVKVSHILFEIRNNDSAAALAKANDARAKLLAGVDFTELAKKLSDEPNANAGGGQLPWFGAGTMDPDFTKAAFAMKTVGELSEPVRTRFGYHLIRFEGRRPPRQQTFDEVKDAIMAQMRNAYVAEKKDAVVDAIRKDPNMKVDQKAVDALVYYPDPSQFKPVPTSPPAE